MNCTYNIQYIYLLSLTLFISTTTSAQEESHLNFFLTSQKQNSLDSTSEEKRYYSNGTLKEKITVMHSHYYAFDIQKEKFLRKTFIKAKEIYNANGILERKDSLAPLEQGHYFEKFFYTNGKKKKVIIYEFRGNYQPLIKPDRDVSLPNDFEKVTVYSIDKKGNKTYRYKKKALQRYVVHQRGNIYDITGHYFEGEFRDYPNNKYITFEPRKKHMEVQIIDPANDSVLCRLKYKYTSGFLNSTNPEEVRKFIIRNAIVYATVPCIKLYDQQTRKIYILNRNFERIIKEPVESCRPLTRASNHTNYFWICNEKCGLYNFKGKNIIPQEHDPYVLETGDFLKISANRQYSCVDYQGNVIIPYRKDIEDFTIHSDNVATIYKKGFSAKGKGGFYLNLLTRDTIQMYKQDNANPFTCSDQWMRIKSNRLLNDFQIIQDSLAFLELKNPRYYDINGADREFWYQKYVLKLPDSLQRKTDLLIRYPDFDPVEYKYVLYNLKINRADTVNVKLKALEGIPSYSISMDAHSFVNGYVRLEIVIPNSYQRLYSLLSYNGEIVNIQRPYTKIEDVNDHGQAIVQFKEWVNTAAGGGHKEAYGVINMNGEEIVPCEYRSCSLVKRYGYRVFTNNTKWKLIDFDGEVLTKLETTYGEIDRMIRKTENPFIYSFTIDLK